MYQDISSMWLSHSLIRCQFFGLLDLTLLDVMLKFLNSTMLTLLFRFQYRFVKLPSICSGGSKVLSRDLYEFQEK